MTLYDQCSHSVVLLGKLYRISQGGIHGAGQGVFSVQPVDGDRHDASVNVGQNFWNGF